MHLTSCRRPAPRLTRKSARTRPGASIEGRASHTARVCAIGVVLFLAISLAAHAQSIKLLVQSSPLAGFQYYAGSVRWEEMKVGDTLKLVRETDNPHDANAIRVEWHGEKLGYLPRAENGAVVTELDRGGKVEARIARLQRHRNPWQRVLLDVFVAL